MYEVINFSTKEIIFVYVAFMAACFVTYPLVSLISTAAKRGLNKWR